MGARRLPAGFLPGLRLFPFGLVLLVRLQESEGFEAVFFALPDHAGGVAALVEGESGGGQAQTEIAFGSGGVQAGLDKGVYLLFLAGFCFALLLPAISFGFRRGLPWGGCFAGGRYEGGAEVGVVGFLVVLELLF